jgi:hypothetical protein
MEIDAIHKQKMRRFFERQRRAFIPAWGNAPGKEKHDALALKGRFITLQDNAHGK